MSNADSLVSVIVPVYNAGKYIAELCRSLQSQTYPHFEALILDDGSTDETPDVLRQFEEDHRFQISRWDVNRGVSGATRELLERSRGEFWAYPGADDVLLPEFLARRIELMQEHPNAALVHGPTQLINQWSETISGSVPELAIPPQISGARALALLLQHNLIATPSVLVRSSATRKILAHFDVEWRYAQDWHLWLCILHDDDLLEPIFVEAMLELSAAAPRRALYYGLCDVIDDSGHRLNKQARPGRFAWHELELERWTEYNPVAFPAQLFNVAAAKAVGGFRASSRYCADWEMWFKLALNYGAAATNRVVAQYRDHYLIGRGTTAVDVSGQKCAYSNIQRKRHIAWLAKRRPGLRFNRKLLQAKFPIPTRFILQYGYRFSDRMLRYNTRLLQVSPPPHFAYRVFQLLSRVLPSQALRLVSWICQRIPARYDPPSDGYSHFQAAVD